MTPKNGPEVKKGGLKIKKNSTKTGITQVLIKLKQKLFNQQLSLIRDFGKCDDNLVSDLLILDFVPILYLKKYIFGPKTVFLIIFIKIP